MMMYSLYFVKFLDCDICLLKFFHMNSSVYNQFTFSATFYCLLGQDII